MNMAVNFQDKEEKDGIVETDQRSEKRRDGFESTFSNYTFIFMANI